jgi:hypothetical protein
VLYTSESDPTEDHPRIVDVYQGIETDRKARVPKEKRDPALVSWAYREYLYDCHG